MEPGSINQRSDISSVPIGEAEQKEQTTAEIEAAKVVSFIKGSPSADLLFPKK